MAFQKFIKDPEATLDYLIDLKALTNGRGPEDYLQDGDTIDPTPGSYTVYSSEPTELLVSDIALEDNNTSIRFWLTGGTAGIAYIVTAQFTTIMGRTDEKSMKIQVKET
jgi:hypothetical protein